VFISCLARRVYRTAAQILASTKKFSRSCLLDFTAARVLISLESALLFRLRSLLLFDPQFLLFLRHTVLHYNDFLDLRIVASSQRWLPTPHTSRSTMATRCHKLDLDCGRLITLPVRTLYTMPSRLDTDYLMEHVVRHFCFWQFIVIGRLESQPNLCLFILLQTETANIFAPHEASRIDSESHILKAY
jgi:hypothetical protein